MIRIFITGSSDGIELHTTERLIDRGHKVTLHARNEERAAGLRSATPNAEDILVADFGTIRAIKQLAQDANALCRFDTVIHEVDMKQWPAEKSRMMAFQQFPPSIL